METVIAEQERKLQDDQISTTEANNLQLELIILKQEKEDLLLANETLENEIRKMRPIQNYSTSFSFAFSHNSRC